MQEYERINRPLLNFMVQMGSESATVSDGARAWLTVQKHCEALTRADLSRISSSPALDLAQLQGLITKRVSDGLKDAHYLALFMDPRPSMRKFVQESGLLGSAADHTIGNTEPLQAAQRALRDMACVITIEGKTTPEVAAALCKALLIFLNVRCPPSTMCSLVCGLDTCVDTQSCALLTAVPWGRDRTVLLCRYTPHMTAANWASAMLCWHE